MNYKSAVLESGAGGKTQRQLKPIKLDSVVVWCYSAVMYCSTACVPAKVSFILAF